MQRCSKKAYAMCPDRYLCGRIENAVFDDDSECAQFNREVEDKPMTNADKIRAMSDKELATFLCNWRSDNIGNCAGCQAEDFYWNGHTGTIDWLQQEAEGE